MESRLRIIVTGLIAGYPLPGMAWHYLQYLLGLTRLGHEVVYVEDSGRDPYNPIECGPSRRCEYNVEYLRRLMSRFDLHDGWAYHSRAGGAWFGMPNEKREAALSSADLLINVSGSLERPEDYAMVGRLVYVDTDPVFTQLKIARHAGFRARVDAHAVHFSFGERVTELTPPTEHHWHATRQPIVLDAWHQSRPVRDVYTTVMNWTSYKTETDGRHVYGHKDVEFMKFLELPRDLPSVRFEIASAPGRTGKTPHDLLVQNGWQIVSPEVICPDVDSYRAYIESSKAEWSVAKNAYVEGRSGWFSERSACYLAAGRPVIVQDTGFSDVLPVGEGILPFTTLDEAIGAICRVETEYPRHAAAARTIAEEYFDSDKVLTRLLDEAFSSAPNEQPVGRRSWSSAGV